jgi:hypothetical protein
MRNKNKPGQIKKTFAEHRQQLVNVSHKRRGGKSSAPRWGKFLEVQLSPQVSFELPTVVVLDPAGGHSLLTDHLLDEPVAL